MKPEKTTIFGSFSLCEGIFLRASLVKPFYFILVGRKRLQIAPTTTKRGLPDGA